MPKCLTLSVAPLVASSKHCLIVLSCVSPYTKAARKQSPAPVTSFTSTCSGIIKCVSSSNFADTAPFALVVIILPLCLSKPKSLYSLALGLTNHAPS